MEIKIEKGIPIPSIKFTGLTAILRRLDVGDSILWLPTHVSNLHTTAKAIGIQIATRTEGDRRRIWRIA